MSPQARFRRGLLKCLYSWHCHSRTLKKTADWYFGKTYSSFYCNSRKLKSYIVVHNIPSRDFINLRSFLYEKKAATNLPTCFHDIITQFIYATIRIFIRFLGCISLNISACIFAATCIYICVVLIELCPRICCTQLISTPSSIK